MLGGEPVAPSSIAKQRAAAAVSGSRQLQKKLTLVFSTARHCSRLAVRMTWVTVLGESATSPRAE